MDALRKSIGNDTPAEAPTAKKKPAAKDTAPAKGITLVKSDKPAAKPHKTAKRKSA